MLSFPRGLPSWRTLAFTLAASACLVGKLVAQSDSSGQMMDLQRRREAFLKARE